MSNKKFVLAAALVASGLSAGLLYGWSVSVIPGLSLLGDKEFILTLQAINKTIQNPLFFLSFMGAALLIPAAAFMFRSSHRLASRLLTIIAGVYLIGVMGVTSMGNLPLSDQLDTHSVATMGSGELAEARQAYEGPWNAWHTVRTVASIAAFAGIIGVVFVIRQGETRQTKGTK